MNANDNVSDGGGGDLVTSRVFDAPRERVWRAFTEAESLMKWWGPRHFAVVVAKMDLRPGGMFHYRLRTPDGYKMWAKCAYREIVPQQRLIYLNAFSDESGATIQHPLMPNWPLELPTTVTFDEDGEGRTKVTVRWTLDQATEEQRKAFDESHDTMQQGWRSTFDELAQYLAKS